MKLDIAVQMDPLGGIDISADSTFALMLEAQNRGHNLYYYLPQALSFRHNRVLAEARPVRVQRDPAGHYSERGPEIVDLSDFDVVLMRQDPPFDMSYITATHLLEHIHPQTLVVNDPFHVRNAPEKLFVTHFPDLMPPTLISSDRREIDAFREEHGELILKPLFGNGGAGVFHLTEEDDNLGSLLEMFTQFYREPIIVQRYLPAVRNGDKRIILVDGEPVGALNRVPAKGEARSNLHVGGKAAKAVLDDRDREICGVLGSQLRDKGLIFVGIDVIGGYLTEINVTSPTGIQEIERFDGTNIAALIWEAIERRRER